MLEISNAKTAIISPKTTGSLFGEFNILHKFFIISIIALSTIFKYFI